MRDWVISVICVRDVIIEDLGCGWREQDVMRRQCSSAAACDTHWTHAVSTITHCWAAMLPPCRNASRERRCPAPRRDGWPWSKVIRSRGKVKSAWPCWSLVSFSNRFHIRSETVHWWATELSVRELILQCYGRPGTILNVCYKQCWV